MMADYFAYVQDCHRQLMEVKRKLADPLYQIAQAYFERHYELHRLWSMREQAQGNFDTINSQRKFGQLSHEYTWMDRALKSWKASIPGKMKKALDDLVKRYVIFSFFGSGYDHAFLQSYLLPLFFELKLAPKMEKSGNKVVTISTRGGISFRDITKLLSPGTSLRQFAKTTNLTMEKSYFPFSLLTGFESLQIASLPSRAEDWKSDLTGPAVTQAEVDHSIELFVSSGCRNLGEYLRVYLLLDVEILFRAIVVWRRYLKKHVNVDFIESAKFTISSLSHLAGQRSLAQMRAVGNFFPNNSQVYRLLKRGMRGGLCTVLRSEAGAQDLYRREARLASKMPAPSVFHHKRRKHLLKRAGYHYRNNTHLINQKICGVHRGPWLGGRHRHTFWPQPLRKRLESDDSAEDNYSFPRQIPSESELDERDLAGNPLHGATGTFTDLGARRSERCINELASGIRRYRSQRLTNLNDGGDIMSPAQTMHLEPTKSEEESIENKSPEVSDSHTEGTSSSVDSNDEIDDLFMNIEDAGVQLAELRKKLERSLNRQMGRGPQSRAQVNLNRHTFFHKAAGPSSRDSDKLVEDHLVHGDQSSSSCSDMSVDRTVEPPEDSEWELRSKAGRSFMGWPQYPNIGCDENGERSENIMLGDVSAGVGPESTNVQTDYSAASSDEARQLTTVNKDPHESDSDDITTAGFSSSDSSTVQSRHSVHQHHHDHDLTKKGGGERRKYRRQQFFRRDHRDGGIRGDTTPTSENSNSPSPQSPTTTSTPRATNRQKRFAPTRSLRRAVRMARLRAAAKDPNRRRFHQRWRPNYRQPGRSNHLAYYDAASLYPSSGECVP